MKIKLKLFQEDAVDDLVSQMNMAKYESQLTPQAIILSSPTGSGKTIIATASIERILQGDDNYGPNKNAVFLWLSDQPEINLQTKNKMINTSSILDHSRLHIIESSFDQRVLNLGKVFFLNTQKIGKDKQLVTHGDKRKYTIWETISNTVKESHDDFFVFIDEAHRGMLKSKRESKSAETIVQKFIKGSTGEIPPIPIVIGISATPERFDYTIQGTNRVLRRINVPIEGVIASGLLKDIIKLYFPTINQPTDVTLLQASTHSWLNYLEHWKSYCKNQNEEIIKPILVVQVQDGSKNKLSNTDLEKVIVNINTIAGPFEPEAFAHSFQEGHELNIGSYKIRYIPPADIAFDTNVKVVLFKTSLNTGWDCPRAEVMMSFRRAVDATSIAQLVGRMVRTPLARRIEGDDFLNSVALYLPHYDEQGLNRVIDKLTNPDADNMPPVGVTIGAEIETLMKNNEFTHIFIELEKLPSYSTPKRRKVSGVRRLLKLARLLVYDSINNKAINEAHTKLMSVLKESFKEISSGDNYKTIVESKGKIKVKSINWEMTSKTSYGESIEIDIANENIDDLFNTAGRKFGEGLHKLWWRSRANQGNEMVTTGKLEAIALAMEPVVIQRLEEESQNLTRSWLANYRLEINKLSENRKQQYNEVRLMASTPELISPIFPDSIEVRKGDTAYPKHLYINSENKFFSKYNQWEKKLLEEEVEKAYCWLRNFDRKAWSVAIPYEYSGETKIMYPDFIFIRDTDSGYEIDILDPHSINLADSPAKAAGLARYASNHSHEYGRIELIIIEKDRIKRLDLKDENIRRKVITVTSRDHLLQLYDLE